VQWCQFFGGLVRRTGSGSHIGHFTALKYALIHKEMYVAVYNRNLVTNQISFISFRTIYAKTKNTQNH
jgi:hypothetical protein